MATDISGLRFGNCFSPLPANTHGYKRHCNQMVSSNSDMIEMEHALPHTRNETNENTHYEVFPRIRTKRDEVACPADVAAFLLFGLWLQCLEIRYSHIFPTGHVHAHAQPPPPKLRYGTSRAWHDCSAVRSSARTPPTLD